MAPRIPTELARANSAKCGYDGNHQSPAFASVSCWQSSTAGSTRTLTLSTGGSRSCWRDRFNRRGCRIAPETIPWSQLQIAQPRASKCFRSGPRAMNQSRTHSSALVTCRLKRTSSLLRLLLRVVGCLPRIDGATVSVGRRPTSLRGGNRGPATRGGACVYGESAIVRRRRIGRPGSSPVRRTGRGGVRASTRRLWRPSRGPPEARDYRRLGRWAERRRHRSQTSGGRGWNAVP